MAPAIEHFTHLPKRQAIACRRCRVCLWPSQVAGHLRGGQHKVSKKEAQAVSDEISTWAGVQHYPTEFELPRIIDQPIPGLPLYEEARRCIVGTDCPFITNKPESMKLHWRKQHEAYSQHRNGGGSGQVWAKNAQARFEKGARRVQCQRLFAQGPHSQYIEVQRPEEATVEQVRGGSAEKALERAWEQANSYWDTMREKQNDTIQAGETDEVNPWLKRTGWIEYLQVCDRKDLLKVVEQPGSDEEEEEDSIEVAIWRAMGSVARVSQRTVDSSGVMLRMEAIRTEMHEPKYTPLQGYQEAAAVDKHVQPWQQMLMFFVRTRRMHAWTSPEYRFSRQQDAAFKAMMAAAEAQARSDESEESEGSDESGSESGDDGDSDEGSRSKPDESERPMTRLEKACMGFCIELLNQRIHNREYDMALICGMAVLGVAPFGGGYRDPETYPPVLSSIVKIAHFMVVQHAEHIATPFEEGQEFSPSGRAYDFDEGYESAGSDAREAQFNSSWKCTQRGLTSIDGNVGGRNHRDAVGGI